MSLRLILASCLVLILALISLVGVSLLHYLLVIYGPLLPATVNIFIGPYPTNVFVWTLGGILLAVTTFCFILLYIIIDRFFVHPVLMVASTLSAFATQPEATQLPEFTLRTKEMRSLVTSFSEFAARVTSVHARDTEISRVKSDFISTAAHQIRTPLTGIRWALEALQKEPLTPTQQELVSSATDKSHDLVAIIGTLLDISSIESGKYKYKFEIANLGTIAESVTHDFIPLAQKGNVVLAYEKNDAPLPPVRIDPERIKWVLNNLIENAIRYTPAQGRVTVGIRASVGRLVVQVSDTGIGIPVGDRTNIFERFYRAGNAIAKENQGNGLGLYIARTIATDHGGDLNFAPNPSGIGTVFSLSLPIAQSVAGVG